MKPPLTQDYHDNNRQTLLENLLFPVRKVNRRKLDKAATGKTVLITGASYGIGAMIAEKLSYYNTTLILIGRTSERLEALRQQFAERPCTAIIFSTDIRNEEQVNDLLSELNKQQLAPDILINNAGKSINRGLNGTLNRFHDVQRCSATNFTGPVQLLLGILPSLIEKKGHILNVSTLTVMLPHTAGWSAYHASKAAFDDWLKCMEPELRKQQVMVSSVYLPLVRTKMSMVNEKNHKRPAMSKAKAANAVLNCLAYKKRKYRPWWIGVPLFANALFPNLWYRIQLHFIKQSK